MQFYDDVDDDDVWVDDADAVVRGGASSQTRSYHQLLLCQGY